MTISDEVWQRLDPHAGKLPRRTARRLGVAALAAVVLLAASVAIWRTGLVVPRLVWPGGIGHWQTDADGSVRIDFLVENAGEFPVTVERVGRSAPGLQLLAVEGGTVDSPDPAPVFPQRLSPHTGVGAVLVYRITSCDQAPKGSWPVTAQVQRPWGTMTVDVAEPAILFWQEEVVGSWCRPGG